MGVPEEEIETALGRDGEDGDEGEEDGLFQLWPDNERAVGAWLLVCRQWRIGPMGGVMGLDYPGVEALLRMNGTPVDAVLLMDLAVMECAAAPVLNARGGR